MPPNYKLALLKNEFGDVAIDSQLAASQAISGVQELLNGCKCNRSAFIDDLLMVLLGICCNLVGQLSDALDALRRDVSPDRIIIETSGSAFPATLAMEINRLSRETGHYVLDGVMTVIDVENWKGYEDTSMTARLQVRKRSLVWTTLFLRNNASVYHSIGAFYTYHISNFKGFQATERLRLNIRIF